MRSTSETSSGTTYHASLAWLYKQSRGDARRDPARMQRLVAELGLQLPQRAVLVVGTNGKGTVTAMTAAAATAAGIRTGRFISPHVEDYRERIAVDGEPIGRAQVVEFVERVRSTSLSFKPAFFELTFAMALEHFARSSVDFTAIEAGVGARHDATAVVEDVIASAITPISLDHIETLGPTLRDIASDKSAAIRRGVPAASAAQVPEVVDVLTKEARLKGTTLAFDTPDHELFSLPATLQGESDPVRLRNARLAAATVRLTGLIQESALAEGLEIPPLPGRGERFRIGDIEVILDGAHDPTAGAALAERAGRKYVLLFGSLRRKQGEETLRSLESQAERVFVTSAGGEPIMVSATGSRTFIREPAEALQTALSTVPPGGLLVIGGSLYLAGELRPLLRDHARGPGQVP